MATNNAVNTTLSGQTGGGSFAGSTSPTFVTPVLGAASATSLNFSTIVGLIGDTTGTGPSAGSVGEIMTSVVTSGAPISLVTGVTANITSLPLTAGDWDVYGLVGFTMSVGASNLRSGTSPVSGALPTTAVLSSINPAAGTTLLNWGSSSTIRRVISSSASTVYLVANAIFAAGTADAFGTIFARRRR